MAVASLCLLDRKVAMKKYHLLVILALAFPLSLSGQDVGTAADVPSFSMAFSYERLSRDFRLAGIRQEIHRDIYRATLGLKPWEGVSIYGFVGSSNFPNSYVSGGRTLYFGGGLKFLMVGEVDIREEDGHSLLVRGAVGLDFQISRLQSSHTADCERLGLTRYQGCLDFGLRIWQVAGYFGFKFSRISGPFHPALSDQEIDAKGTGLFSMILGLNWHLCPRVALVSEFSFFTERTWGLGLRIDL